MVSSVTYNFKQSVSASGGTGFDLTVHLEKGDTKEELIELGRAAIAASKELMKEKFR